MQSLAVLDLPKTQELISYSDGSVDFAISPELAAHYDRNNSVLWTRLAPRGIPSFTLTMLEDLERASRMIEGHFAVADRNSPLDYLVLRSACPGAFNVGGDLGFFQRMIAAQDRAALTEYARNSINVVYRNYTAHNLRGVTSIALLEGDALGGGFECALSCDIIIAERHVKAGFPEILFDMFPGMGGVSFLSRRVKRAVANELVRSGRQYCAQELFELGIIDEVVATGDGSNAILRLIRRRAHQRGGHNAMNAVDRLLHPISLQELHDVVKLWVDCALQASPRAQAWMQRLYQRQLAIFGHPLETAASFNDTLPTLVAVAA